jgi:hypothetical protein
MTDKEITTHTKAEINPRADRFLNRARYHASWMLFFTMSLMGVIFFAAIAYQDQSGIGIAGAGIGALVSALLTLHNEGESRHYMRLYELAIKRQVQL